MYHLSPPALLLLVATSYLALEALLSGLLFLRRHLSPGRVLLPLGIALAEVPLLILQRTGNLSAPTWLHLFFPIAGAILLAILVSGPASRSWKSQPGNHEDPEEPEDPADAGGPDLP